jgi:hypothetical protein
MIRVFSREGSPHSQVDQVVVPAANLHRSRRSWLPLWAAVGTAALAAALRLPIVNYGLPFLWHPDEPANVGLGAHMVDNGTWNPHSFLYPSMLYDVVAIVGRVQHALGGWHFDAGNSTQGMGTGYTTDPHLYLALRLITVALSVGTCVVVFGIVHLVTKRWWAATIAAALLAVSPLMVLNGVYITPDTYSAFFTAFGLLAALWVLRRGRRLDYVIAGIAVGLAAGAKYDPAVVAVSVIIAHFLRSPGRDPAQAGAEHLDSDRKRPSWLRDAPLLVLAGITSIVAFLVTTPGAIMTPHAFVHDIRFVAHYYGTTGHAGNTGSSFVFYMQVLAHQGLLFTLMVACGLVSLMGRWRREALVVIGFVVCYTALISAQVVHFDREFLPSLVGLAALTGIGTATAADVVRPYLVGRAWMPGIAVSALAVALIGLGLGTSASSSTQAYAQVRQHPRSEAQAWIYQHIPEGSRLIAELYAPWIDPTRYHVAHVEFVVDTKPVVLSNAAAIVVTQQGSGRFLAHAAAFKGEVAAYVSFTSRFCERAAFTDGPWIRIFVPCSP